MDTTDNNDSNSNLNKYLSPLNVWALSFGCAVGWGAFVMPGTVFLPVGGPAGTALGMTIGGIILLIIGYNYHYMMNKYPDAGGTYAFSKKVFGYDHGFLSAWFLILVYAAIVWANATALPLIFRNLPGLDLFRFGYLYQIAGYDVYFGEVLLSNIAFALTGLICIRGGKFVAYIQTAAALILLGGICICFYEAVGKFGTEIFNFKPDFAPDKNTVSAIFGIVVLAPWAFAGFESVSQSVEGFKFSVKKTFAILFFAVIAGIFAYVTLTLIATSATPKFYVNWSNYVKDIPNLTGLPHLPTFFAANLSFGDTGLIILAFTVTSAVITGLIGNYVAGSRLLYALAKDNLLPNWFAKLNIFQNPRNILICIILISLPIPFLGRTAISWIIDVNTIGATIAYAYTSATAFVFARKNGYLPAQITGAFGVIVSVIFFAYFMVPNFWLVSAMATESYLILIAWSMLGFVFFRYIFRRDEERNFGKNSVVWMSMLFLIFFTSTIWLRQVTHDSAQDIFENLNMYYVEELNEHGVPPTAKEKAASAYYLHSLTEEMSSALTSNNMVQIGIIALALFVMFNIYNMMMRRERELEIQKVEAEQSSRAKTTFLSNMSHDIRTPMNAIIGYTNLIKKEKDLPDKAQEYLNKIEASNKHLLALINDILDMSRIESGKMELEPVKSNLIKVMEEVRDLFSTQMVTKSIDYKVTWENVTNKFVLCDTPRLNRVLLNLISNAYKFTPAGGKVIVSLTQTGANENFCSYELRVKDTGMGMTPEFATKVFDAYSRDRTVNSIQGTGLGMAITKGIVELMNGTIDVKSAPGKGTEFTVKLSFPPVEEEPEKVSADSGEMPEVQTDFSKVKLLLVEDNLVNREIASLILTEYGFQLDTAENGKEAVEKVSASKPGDYQAVLMDIQMPIMDGYAATGEIRKLDNPELANIPIIAMTANAFTEDIQAAKDAGMTDHIAKPIDIPNMIEVLTKVLK